MRRLFLDRGGASAGVESHDAVALRILQIIGEDGGAIGDGSRIAQYVRQAMAIEQIVAENERRTLAGVEISADDIGLGQTFRSRLFGIGKLNASLIRRARLWTVVARRRRSRRSPAAAR